MADQEDFFPCDECEESFDKVDKLNLHKRSKHLALNLNCGTCKFQAKTASSLNTHMKTHDSSKTVFSCEECTYADQLEENLLNHKIAKHVVFSCNKCDQVFSQENEHKEHELLAYTEQQNRNTFSCDECNFNDKIEENVLNHKIRKHTTHTCDLCDYKCTDEKDLEHHIQAIHKVTKLACNICQQVFSSLTNLNDHKKKKHEAKTYPCDHCGHKANNLEKLDEHIENYHKIKKSLPGFSSKFINRYPCDFKSPSHSSSCCDRDQGPRMKIYSPEQRIQNEPCKNWNENFCRFSDLCRYAHIEPCKFQERCFSPANCIFFHFNRSNASFLGGKYFRSLSFKMNPREFPPLLTPAGLEKPKSRL